MSDWNLKTPTDRLKRSCVYAIITVGLSAIAFSILLSLEDPAKLEISRTFEIASYVLALPLTPGWFIGNAILTPPGSCGSIEQLFGTIIAITLISVAVDTAFIFGIWELLYRKRSRDLVSHDTLHISG